MHYRLRLTVIFCLFILFDTNMMGQVEDFYLSANQLRSDDVPEYIKLLADPEADPDAVIRAYTSYYSDRPFVKNEYSQYYKRWLKNISREVEHRPGQRRRSVSRMTDWTCLGPWDWDHDAAGRSYAPGSAHVYVVEQSISDPDVLYAGTATTGLWKSTDHGENWVPLTYDEEVNSVYALEIDHSDPNTVYAVMYSSIYKTTDGGSSWTPTGDAAFQSIGMGVEDIVMHPSDSDIVLAATDQGLYRTNDGGASWTLIDANHHREIEFHPTDSDIVYVVRKVGDFTQFAKSVDAGVSFTVTGTGWPNSGDHQRRTEIAVSPDAPDYVFAHATGSANGGSGLYGIYTSSDQGATWTFDCCGPQPAGPPDLPSGNINIMAWAKDGSDNGGQYYYNVAFGVSPFNADSIWAAGTNMWVSDDRGVSFICHTKWSEPGNPDYIHADIHDFHYYSHTGEIWVASDGGIFKSTDNGLSFIRKTVGIEGSDFWGFGQGWWEGDIMLGGTYHNGTLLKENNVYINDWICTDGGDGNFGSVNPGRPKNVHSWFNIKDLKSDRTIAPVTRGNPHEANASYIVGEDSDILYHPNYYDTWFVGSDSTVYVTYDNGFTFTNLHKFPGKVAAMDLCLQYPDVLYAATWPGWWDTKRIYRSEDAGQTWTEITPPASSFSTNLWVPFDIVADPLDPAVVTIVRTSMYSGTNLNGARVFQSTDKGQTWTNITGTNMDGEAATVAGPHYGVPGGIIIGTRKKVWYKDSNLSDFEDVGSDLPMSTFSEKVFAYYREQKIRTATNRSVWERALPYASSRVIANPSVDKKDYYCAKDTVQFVDVSVLAENGAQWLWHFPGGTPEYSDLRNPKVVYDCPGEFDVTLTVSDVYGSDTRTMPNMVKVWNDCDYIDEPGLTLETYTPGDHVWIDGFDLTVDSFTVTAWVRPEGIQNDYTGIFMNDGTTAGFNFRGGNNTLGYHWPNGSWSWNSGLVVPPDVWSHVAMVATPSGMTLYLNGVPSTHSVSLASADLTNVRIGSYKGWNSRNFVGQIDDVCAWNRALSTDEIRELRHINKDANGMYGMVAYYKMNRQQTGVHDAVSDRHGSLLGNAQKVPSYAPVGQGVSDRVSITSSGIYTLPKSGVSLEFNGGGNPGGEVVVSHLISDPKLMPPNYYNVGKGYYVFNNYGSNAVFGGLTTLELTDAGTISNAMSSNIAPAYFERNENEGQNPWSDNFPGPYTLNSGLNGGISFDDASFINSFDRQIMVLRDPFNPTHPNAAIVPEPAASTLIEGGESMELALISDVQALWLPLTDSLGIDQMALPPAGAMAYDSLNNEVVFYNGDEWRMLMTKALTDVPYNPMAARNISVQLGSTGLNSSALLDLSKSGGFVALPSYSSSDLLDIDSPTPSMLVFDSDAKGIRLYNATKWALTASNPVDLTSTGNQGTEGLAVGKTNRHPTSALEISNANTAALGLTKVNAASIANPQKGMLVYDAVRNEYLVHDGQFWRRFTLE